MLCVNPFRRNVNGVDMFLPCGKCLPCRINKRNEWTQRLLHESYQDPTHTYFLTLTYDDEHLPEDLSVHKEDIQLFFKRLRKFCGDTRIRYFLSSEYGSPEFGARPHYHCIIFGLPDLVLVPQDNYIKGMQLNKKDNLINRKINDIWGKGFITVSQVCRERCSYCAKYFVTKQDSPEGRLENFSLMSRRNGIGYEHAQSIKEKVRKYQLHTCFADNGKIVSLPRYYRNKIYSDEERKELIQDLTSEDFIEHFEVLKDYVHEDALTGKLYVSPQYEEDVHKRLTWKQQKSKI